MKNNSTISKNSKELAHALGLSPVDAFEWEVRYLITKRIIFSAHASEMTITSIAKNAGTSRARVTRILKDDTLGISLDVLVRVLAAIGDEMKISFKKSA